MANGTKLRTGANATETRRRMETVQAEILWSLTPTDFGASPGTDVVDMTVRADTWLTARTVAAQIQGPPNIPHIKLIRDRRTMSK